MAQKAKKDRAKNNSSTLNKLHIGTISVNVVFLLFNYFVRRRSLIAYFLISTPCLIAELVLEKTGRPTYDKTSGTLKSSGEDLSAPGLTEYMFDLILITWLSLVSLMIFGKWGWLVWSIVPAYSIYKGYELVVKAKNMIAAKQPDQNVALGGNRKQRRAH
ncbi:hypothetical protein K3495_g4411 [Podosphaera aphanis]|nr:hypothetical protein K3495_g4411 [Podosphaera aphanis]